jgi:lysozyme
MIRTISDEGIALIKRWEGTGPMKDGMHLAYKCPAGVWTIGWGSTLIDGKPVRAGMKITRQRADELLKADVARMMAVLRKDTPNLDAMPQKAFDAIASATYNLGPGMVMTGTRAPFSATSRRGSIWRGIVARNPEAIARGLSLYVKAGGRTLPGLVKRRAEEAKMVREAVWDFRLPPDVPKPEPQPTPPVLSWWERFVNALAFWR